MTRFTSSLVFLSAFAIVACGQSKAPKTEKTEAASTTATAGPEAKTTEAKPATTCANVEEHLRKNKLRGWASAELSCAHMNWSGSQKSCFLEAKNRASANQCWADIQSKEAALLAFCEAGKMSAKKLGEMGGSIRPEVSQVILAKSMKSNIVNPQIAGVFGELAQSSKSTELKLKLKSNLRREIYSALEKAGVKSDTCGYLDKVLAKW